MSERKVEKVVANAFYMYLSNIANISLGALFWIIIGSIASPRDFGDALAVTSFAGVVSGVIDLGLSGAVVRFLGEYSSNEKMRLSIAQITLLAKLLIHLASSVAIVILSLYNPALLGLQRTQIIIAALFIALGFSSYFSSALLGVLETKPLLISTVIGNTAKIIIALYLYLFMGLGWIAIAIGYLMVSAPLLVIGPIYLREILFKKEAVLSREVVWSILKAGFSIWIPGIISLIASPLIGVLIIYNVSGYLETGGFYIATTIAGFTTALSGALLSVSLPYIASLRSEEISSKTATISRITRLSLSMAIPLAVPVIVFSREVLSLIREEYVGASSILILLVFSNLISIVPGMISNYLYAEARYRDVLSAGFIASVARILLYGLFAPSLGGLGISLTYLLISILSLAIYAYIIGKEAFLSITTPSIKTLSPLILVLVSLFRDSLEIYVNWLIIFAILLALSLLLEIRTRGLDKEDLVLLARALIPREVLSRISPFAKTLLEILY